MYRSDGMERSRAVLVREVRERGVTSRRVLDAMMRVPRHRFVSEALGFSAYRDHTLPIGLGQTASKPSIVGRMIQALYLTGAERVLEVGTGSGYQTALLAELAAEVVSIERMKELSLRAREVLIRLNYGNVKIINTGDFMGIDGLFDAVIVSAGADEMPQGILSKVKAGGVLVIPVGREDEHVIRRFMKKNESDVVEEELGRAAFVPLVESLNGRN